MLLLLACILVVEALVFEYYISPAGLDTNEGTTEAEPLLTINAAISKVSGDDSIRIFAKPGNYAIPTGISLPSTISSVEWIAEGPSPSTIYIDSPVLISTPEFTISGFIIRGTSYSSGTSMFAADNGCSVFKIESCTFSNISNYTSLLSASQTIRIEDSSFQSFTLTKSTGSTESTYLIFANNDGDVYISNSIFRDVTAEHMIFVYNDGSNDDGNVKVRNSSIAANGLEPKIVANGKTKVNFDNAQFTNIHIDIGTSLSTTIFNCSFDGVATPAKVQILNSDDSDIKITYGIFRNAHLIVSPSVVLDDYISLVISDTQITDGQGQYPLKLTNVAAKLTNVNISRNACTSASCFGPSVISATNSLVDMTNVIASENTRSSASSSGAISCENSTINFISAYFWKNSGREVQCGDVCEVNGWPCEYCPNSLQCSNCADGFCWQCDLESSSVCEEGATDEAQASEEESDSDDDKKKGTAKAVIIGAVVGGAAVLICGIIAFVLVIKLRRRKDKPMQEVELSAEKPSKASKFSEPKVEEVRKSNGPASPPSSAALEELQDIKVGELLGGGNFGSVFRGLWQGTTPIALKKPLNLEILSEFLREASVVSSLNHPNIVRYLGVYSEDSAKYIVMEFLDEGALDVFVQRKKSSLRTEDLIAIATQAAAGMCYLEQKKVVHRDLALRNFLIGKAGEKFVVKVSDFGLSRSTSDGIYTTKDTQIPVKWTAPEALNFGVYTSKSDVWAFGISLWELFSYGVRPYPGFSNAETIKMVTGDYRMEIPSTCPSQIADLIKNCWKAEAEERPTFREIFDILKLSCKEEETGSSSRPVSSTYKSDYYQNQINEESSSMYNT